MSGGVSIKCTGAAAIERRFEKLKRSAQNKILRPAITAACRPVRAAAKANAPTGGAGSSGVLKKSMAQKVKTKKAAVYGMVGPRRGVEAMGTNIFGRSEVRKGSRIAHLSEGGTKPHVILIGPTRARRYWTHPGTPPTRFLSRAWASTRGRVNGILRDKMAAGLRKAGV